MLSNLSGHAPASISGVLPGPSLTTMSNRHSLSDLDDVDEDEDAPVLSATPTPSHHSPQLHRSSSQSSARWTATDTPSHHHAGTSYFHRPVSPTVRQQRPSVARSMSGGSVHRGTRSTSLSSRRDFPDEAVSEEDEDNDSDEDEGGHKQSRGKAAVIERGVMDEDVDTDKDEDPITLKERQSLINVEHPFGLPIWKPALYKKSRSVTRYADEALHSVPSAQAERHLLPGNLFWVVFFGWWLALSCFAVSALLYVVPQGGKRYSSLVFGLGWYIAWPFGKYVEGDVDEDNVFTEDEERPRDPDVPEPSAPSGGVPLSNHSTITPRNAQQHSQTVSWTPVSFPSETTSLIRPISQLPSKSYGATIPSSNSSIGAGKERPHPADFLGKACFWLFLITIITPLLLVVCVACWGLVITIPMAKLNWALITYLFERPTSIRFCAAPPAVVFSSPSTEGEINEDGTPAPMQPPQFAVKHPRLSEGQQAPSSGSPTSKVLLCTYRAVGWKYYKYTVGGVNIMFINLLPLVIFAIIDGFFLLDLVEEREKAGKHVPAILHIIASRALIFFMSLTSVIPLSYFIGMAVASISAQSSIGMGAVINATFGSVIEIILYGIMLTEGKGHLVEGSIVGSLLAGTLLMPGLSMCSGALKKKEQKFNAKSAGVTSMMLIMAFIGTLTPTLFYQTYGNASISSLLTGYNCIL
jgi:Ca2+:H+ antiporter